MIFIDNRYTLIYYRIIQNAIEREYTKDGKERHHIIPESFFNNRSRLGPKGWLIGDPEDSSNIVFLTPREHAFCHKLLVRMTTGKMKSKMILAIWRMLNSKHKKLFSSRDYEKYRLLFIDSIKGMNTGKRKPLSQEHKSKISKSSKGIPKTEVAKNNMKLAWELRNRNVKESTRELNRIASNKYWSSDEAKQLQSQKRKQFLNLNPSVIDNQIKNLNKLISCDNCNKTMNFGNYKRWHGPNCRLNK
jgi:hypothetical protein